MSFKSKSIVYILDTSVILSGKNINFINSKIITTTSVSDELKPGGKDYRYFQYLIERGLELRDPTLKSIKKINDIVNQTGDNNKLSKTDIDILSLALDIIENINKNVIILTDDYSIQNVANFLKINYKNINQPLIKKRIKWNSRCIGCRKKFKDNINICPICGSKTKKIIAVMENIENY